MKRLHEIIGGTLIAFLAGSCANRADPTREWQALDRDLDGVADVVDACFDTPEGARPLHRGCAAVDYVRDAPLLLQDAERGEGPDFDPTFAAALAALAQGDPCTAATLLGPGHAQAGELADVCAQVASSFDLVAHVVDVDDATGLLQLSPAVDGAVVMTRGLDGAFDGAEAALSGLRFADGSTLVTAAVSLPGDPATASTFGLNLSFPCIQPRVAPAQPFWAGAPYVLHNVSAYQASGTLQLEEGMAIAAVSAACLDVSGRTFNRHTLKVIYQPRGAASTSPLTLAADLAAGDAPVMLPDPDVLPQSPNANEALVVQHNVQSCSVLGCGAKVLVSTDTFLTKIDERGSFCAAGYGDVVFSESDLAPFSDTFVTSVSLGTKAGIFPAGFSKLSAFHAEGRKIVNGVPTQQTLAAFQDFAVDDGPELASPSLLLSLTGVDHEAFLDWPRLDGTRGGNAFRYTCTVPRLIRDRLTQCGSGVDSFYRLPFDQAVGRAEGVFGGAPHGGGTSPVGLAGSVPSQHFAIDFVAPEGTHIHAARGGVVVEVREDQSQTSNPGSVTPGYTCPAAPGVVVAEPGNYVTIQSAGVVDPATGIVIPTFETYYHSPMNGVHVTVGQQVERGHYIADVGHVGNASAPHVHFEVGVTRPSFRNVDCDGISDGGNTVNTILARFEGVHASTLKGLATAVTAWLNGAPPDECYEPLGSDNWASTNGG